MKIKINYSFVYIMTILAMFCWSLSFVWIKDAFTSFKPVSIILMRLIIASIIMFGFTYFTKKLNKIDKKDYLILFVLSIFEPFLYFMGESHGLQYVSSTLGAVIISTIPLFTPVAAYFVSKEKISLPNMIGIVVSIMGVFMIIFKKDFVLDAPLKGVMLMLLAVFSTVGYTVVLKKVINKYNNFTIIAYQNFFGIFLFLPFFFAWEYNHFINTVPTAIAISAVIKLAIFGSILAFLLYTYGVKYLGINKSNIFINAIPIFTAIFAYFMLDEKLTSIKIAGMFVVILSLFISQFKLKEKK